MVMTRFHCQLLEHRFFKQAKKPDYIVQHLLHELPPLAERALYLKEQNEQALAKNKMQNMLFEAPAARSWDFRSFNDAAPKNDSSGAKPLQTPGVSDAERPILEKSVVVERHGELKAADQKLSVEQQPRKGTITEHKPSSPVIDSRPSSLDTKPALGGDQKHQSPTPGDQRGVRVTPLDGKLAPHGEEPRRRSVAEGRMDSSSRLTTEPLKSASPMKERNHADDDDHQEDSSAKQRKSRFKVLVPEAEAEDSESSTAPVNLTPSTVHPTPSTATTSHAVTRKGRFMVMESDDNSRYVMTSSFIVML